MPTSRNLFGIPDSRSQASGRLQFLRVAGTLYGTLLSGLTTHWRAATDWFQHSLGLFSPLPRFERRRTAGTTSEAADNGFMNLGPHRILPVDQLPSGSRIPPLRKPLRRRSQMARLFLLGSVPLHGVRPADLPRKPARHRSVPAFARRQALPQGIPAPRWRASTLADANESRDWRIYADFAQVLIRIARPLYARDPIGVDLDQSLYALDSTTIDLCLSLFPWAKFPPAQGRPEDAHAVGPAG